MGFASNFIPSQTPKLNSVGNRFDAEIDKRQHNNPQIMVSPNLFEPSIEENEFEKQLHSVKGFCGETDCMWLSFGSNSGSFFSSDESQDTWEIDLRDMHLQDHLLDMLSLPSHWQKSWRSCDISYERSLSGYSSAWGSSCTSLNSLENRHGQIHDDGATAMWFSLLDLTEEDSELVGNEEQELDTYNSDFPSPSFRASKCSHASSSKSGSVTSSQGFEGYNQSIDSELDEPVFWPFDQCSYWQPELDNIFCISPKKEKKHKVPDAVQSTPPDLKFLEKQSLQYGRKTMQAGCRSKLEFSSPPVSPLTKNHKGKFQSSSSSKHSPDQVITPSKIVRRRKPNQVKEGKRRCSQDQQFSESLLNLEAREIQNIVEQVSIENLVGLNEFDGHEGLETASEEISCSTIIDSLDGM